MIGLLLTQIGTPDQPTIPCVRRYLREFLSDPRVVTLPRMIWLPILHGIILRRRPKKSAALYQKIWTSEGSPLFFFTHALKKKLEEKCQVPVEVGMHYGNPSIKSALEKLRDREVTKIIVLPLYPQYSSTTTTSSFDKVTDHLKTGCIIPDIHFLNSYFDNKNYIAAISESIQKTWETEGQAEHLLFSFHGIPQSLSNRGDPYEKECHQTAALVAEKLQLPTSYWSVAFQSRLGMAKWLTPYTSDRLKKFPKRGVTNLQVICPGFSVDCLETVEEIAIRGKKQFLQAGGKKFFYIPALNDSDSHIAMLAEIAKNR